MDEIKRIHAGHEQNKELTYVVGSTDMLATVVSSPLMRITRVECRWRVLGFGHVMHDCMEKLAYEQGYRLSAICRELKISERHFRDVFLRDVGLTPREWLNWERMVMARRLLMSGVDPLVVSDQLGFSHPNSFRRTFGISYGMSVSRFLEIRERRVKCAELKPAENCNRFSLM